MTVIELARIMDNATIDKGHDSKGWSVHSDKFKSSVTTQIQAAIIDVEGLIGNDARMRETSSFVDGR